VAFIDLAQWFVFSLGEAGAGFLLEPGMARLVAQ